VPWFRIAMPTTLVNDENFNDPRNIANAFNNFFITIAKKLNIQQIEKGDAISVLRLIS
jgi:hypothetical protein